MKKYLLLKELKEGEFYYCRLCEQHVLVTNIDIAHHKLKSGEEIEVITCRGMRYNKVSGYVDYDYYIRDYQLSEL